MVQIQALNKILRSGNLDFVINNDLDAKYFYDYPDEFNFIVNHYRQYGNIPDMETFLDNFNEFSVIEVSESDNYLVDKLNEEYMYKEMVPILYKVSEIIKDGDSREACDYIMTAIKGIEQHPVDVGVDIITQSDIRLQEYLIKKHSEDPWMRPTGFKELDDEIGGLAPTEEFVVIFARTNNGKSWALAKMLTHNWKIGANVGYISPEMSANQIGYRFDTLNKHFSNFALYTGRDTEDDYEQYINELKSESKSKFIVATPMDFDKKITVTKLKKFCVRNQLDILGIDGITYITDERAKRGDNKTTSLTNISEDLMSLSCELKIPIIAVVQANRQGVDESGGAPSLESIRDSDGIAHNASKVISIRHKDDKMKLEVVKARNCKVGSKLSYNWNIDKGIFEFNNDTDDDEYTNESASAPTGNRIPTRQRQTVENKQPIVARRGSNENPF